MLRRFVAFAERHYSIKTLLGHKNLDGRRRPKYRAFDVVLALGLMSFLALASARAASRSRKLARCLSGPLPSDAVLSDAPRKFDLRYLARCLAITVRQMIRKKQLGQDWKNYRVAAIDGTEFDRSVLPLKFTKKRKIQIPNWVSCSDTGDAYLRGVNAVLVNKTPIKLAVAFEGPERGETTVVREDILPALRDHYRGFINAVVADAKHGNRPMIQACVDHGFDFLLRIKENWPGLIDEGERVLEAYGELVYTGSSNRPRDSKSRYRIYMAPISVDLEDGRRVDAQFLKVIKENAGPRDDYPRYFITNIPEWAYKPNELADLYSERFGRIEIETHRDDWQHHHLNHLLDHDPAAIMARLLIVAIFTNIDKVFRARVAHWTGTWAEWLVLLCDDAVAITHALFPKDEVVLVGER